MLVFHRVTFALLACASTGLAAGRPADIPALRAPLSHTDARTADELPTTWTAQRAAVLAGAITEQGSGKPIVGAQVILVGTSLGGVTNGQGTYRLANLPAGPVRIQVRAIGYAPIDRDATLTDGATLTLNFAMEARALSLNAMVVTGTPGGTQVRELGNAIGRVSVAKIAETSPATNIQQLLGQRDAGVVVQPAAGMVGAGSAIRIRGASSLSLTNQPIIYVDGVRVDNNPAGGPNIRQGRTASRLNDFNPEDIESIEIIKGPAAATLYGTEASNGVIQILTKRGQSGAPKFDVTYRAGVNYMDSPEERFRYTYGVNPTTRMVDSFNVFGLYREQNPGKELFNNGSLNSVAASISGGTPLVRYFASADRQSNVGIVDYNWQRSAGGRANVSVSPNDKTKLDVNLNFNQSNTRYPQAADQFGIWDMMVWSSPSLLNTTSQGWRYALPSTAAQVDSRMRNARFTGGVQLAYQPFSWLSTQAKAGHDNGQTTNQVLFPRVPTGAVNFFGARSGGEKSLEALTTVLNTVDLSATAKFAVGRFTTATSTGMQYYQKKINQITAVGSNFPTPDITTIGGAASSVSGETFLENKTLGFYVQEVIGFNNRLFLTGAVRGDANSAFGKDFKAAYYPKLSASWVVNEEAFFQRFADRVNTFKLRSAWGQAGQQPDVFAALRLYAPQTGPGGVPVVTPSSFGNPQLKPERGSELELGFDLGLFGDRLTVAYTRFDKTTTDGIVLTPNLPSSGFPGSTVRNLGKVHNWGNELGVNVNVLQRANLGYELNVNHATAQNIVEDLGGIELQNARVGYPVGGIFFNRIASAGFDASGRLTNVLCESENGAAPQSCSTAPRVFWGNSTPTWWGSINNTVTLYKKLRLTANIEYAGGYHAVDGDVAFGHTTFQNSAKVYAAPDPIFAANQTVIPRLGLGFYDAGWAKLRELGANYDLPSSLAGRVGSDRVTVSIAARNVAILWRAQKDIWGTKIFDSETRVPGGSELGFTHQTVIPPTSQIVFTVRMNY